MEKLNKSDKIVLAFLTTVFLTFLIIVAVGCEMMFQGQVRNDQIDFSQDRE